MTKQAWPLLLFLILILLGASLAAAQGVQPYPQAFTDSQVLPKTAMPPPPVNTVFRDPDFGSLMVRVTDDKTDPKHVHPYFRNPMSETNPWSADGRKFFLVTEDVQDFAFGFDPSTMSITSLPGAGSEGPFVLPLRNPPTFSFVDPDLMYGTEVSAPLTIASYRFSTGAITPLLDVTTCHTQPSLVAGHHVYSTDLSISGDDNRIEINAGGTEPGNRTFVIVYDKKFGCRWYNTQTGQIGGEWGPTGLAVGPSDFLINHAYISGSGQYVRIEKGNAGKHDQKDNIGFYVWDVNTLNVKPCYIHQRPFCAGYGSLGYNTYINEPGVTDEMNVYRRPLGNLDELTQLVNPLPTPHLWGMEMHFAWSGGHLNDNVPFCGSTYSGYGKTQITQPYDNEIFCMETDGIASTIWRFAHHRATWDSEYYWSEPFGNVSLDGRFLMFTSGWDGQVGTNADGDPRTDIWIVKLE